MITCHEQNTFSSGAGSSSGAGRFAGFAGAGSNMIMGEEVPFRPEEEDECTYYTINSENEEECMTPVKMKRKRTPYASSVV